MNDPIRNYCPACKQKFWPPYILSEEAFQQMAKQGWCWMCDMGGSSPLSLVGAEVFNPQPKQKEVVT